MSVVADFADSSWFIPYLKDKQGCGESNDLVPTSRAFGSNLLKERHTQVFIDRFYTVRYFPDVENIAGNDICIFQHSNRICVIGLAPGHHLFRKCVGPCQKKIKLSAEATNMVTSTEESAHELLGLDFQLSRSFNLLTTNISGRRKRGCHTVHRGLQCIGFAVCSRGLRHPVLAGLPGRLFEVNSRLALPVADLPQKSAEFAIDMACGDVAGRLAMQHATHSRLRLTSIGRGPVPTDYTSGGEVNSAYICIVMPPQSFDFGLDRQKKSSALRINREVEVFLETGLDWEAYQKLRCL